MVDKIIRQKLDLLAMLAILNGRISCNKINIIFMKAKKTLNFFYHLLKPYKFFDLNNIKQKAQKRSLLHC